MIKQIGHIAITVKDMEKALEFYCGKLGFQKAFELNKPSGEPWIVYIKIAGLQFLELFYGGEHQVESVPNTIGFNHVCLEVEDIHETAQHLRDVGVTLDVEPKQGLDHNWQCWARDPDGTRIEFMQLVAESPHMNC